MFSRVADAPRSSGEAAAQTVPETGESTSSAGRRRWLVGLAQILGVVALISLAVVYSRAPGSGDAPVPAAGIGPNVAAPIVSIVVPVATTNRLTVRATGTINVRNHVVLAPEVTGRVVSMSPALRAGGAFRAGETLLVIDRQDFELSLAQARADIEAAKSLLLLQQAESEAARANYALLHPNAAVPPLVARIPQIEQAKAQVSAARARADIAALELSRTTFTLPFDGKVTESMAEIGQLLTKGVAFGQAFALDAVEAVVPVAADDLQALVPAAGRGAVIRSESVETTGRVERVSPELDERTRFARLYLELDDASVLPPGTFVDVEIAGPTLANTFVLPETTEQIGGAVWIVRGGALEQVQPRVHGRTAEGWIVDAFDIADGVVTGAVPGGSEGLAVQIGELP